MSETDVQARAHWHQGLFIYFLALGVRVLYLTAYLGSALAGHYRTDHQFYRDWGYAIARGHWESDVYTQSPMYAWMLGGWYALTGGHEAGLLLIQTLIGSGTCWLIYATAHELFDRRVALIAGMCAALYGPFVFFDVMIMKTFLSPFLTMLVLYACLHYQLKQRTVWIWLAGLSIGLSTLIRENHLLLLIPVILFLWFPVDHGLSTLKTRMKGLGLLGLGCLIVIAPVTIRNYFVAGQFVMVTTGGGEVFYMAHGPDANGYYSPPGFVRTHPIYEHADFRSEAKRRTGQPDLSAAGSSRYWFWQGIKEIFANPWRSLKLTATKFQILLNDYEVPDSAYYLTTREFVFPLAYLPGFGLFSGLGILGLVVSCNRGRTMILPIGLLLAHLISVLLIYNFARFRLGMLPLWLMFSAAGIDWLWRVWTTPQSRRWPRLLAVPTVILVTLFSLLPHSGRIIAGYPDDEEAYRQFILSRQQVQQDVNRLRSRVGPDDIAGSLQLASGLMQLERYAEARDLLQPLVKKHPQNLQLHRFLGAIYTQTREWKSALVQLKQAHQLAPGNAEICVNLGGVCEKLAEQSDSNRAAELYQQATDYWKQALALDPQNPVARFNLARDHIRNHQFSAALVELEQLLSEHPDYERAETELETLVQSSASDLNPAQYRTIALLSETLSEYYAQSGRTRFQMHATQLALDAARLSGDPKVIQRLEQAKESVSTR